MEGERVSVKLDISTLCVRGEDSGRGPEREGNQRDTNEFSSTPSLPLPCPPSPTTLQRCACTDLSAAFPMWESLIPALRSSTECEVEREVRGVEAVEAASELSPFLGLAA